jgi:hypothetical protein
MITEMKTKVRKIVLGVIDSVIEVDGASVRDDQSFRELGWIRSPRSTSSPRSSASSA